MRLQLRRCIYATLTSVFLKINDINYKGPRSLGARGCRSATQESLRSTNIGHWWVMTKSIKLCESHIIKTSHEMEWIKLTTIQIIVLILKGYTELNHGEKKSTRDLSCHPHNIHTNNAN